LLTVALLIPDAIQSAEPQDAAVGRKVSDFHLRDVLGKPVSLADFREQKAVVAVFLGTECPLAKVYIPRLNELHARLGQQGVALVAIDSNVQDTLSKAAAFVRRYEVAFPLLMDPDGAVADAFGATRTPQAFVLDAARVVRYEGRIDDQFGVGYQRPKATREDVMAAVDELLAGKPVGTPETKTVGCIIGRAERSKKGVATITYSEHVASILQQRCVECHRPGEIAPFPLMTYEDARPWAEMMAEVVRERRMPPWFANPEFGHFSNSAQLPEAERNTLLAWVEQGCVEGDPAKTPPPPTFTSEWGIGEPDLVLKMADKPYTVAATGSIAYQHYTVDPGFTKDMWMTASESRPGNRSVVHHILVFSIPPGSSLQEQFVKGHLIAAFAPGVPPHPLPPGQATLLHKGSKIVMQVHYTANGRVEEDMSSLGLKFCRAEDVKQKVDCGMAINVMLSIKPNLADQQFRADYVFPEDRMLLTLTPHMHLRGKAFRYEAVYPDGKKEILLDVPRYDFNWQITYKLAEPKLLPKGTRLRCYGTFDNSADNLSNPNPNRFVRFGEQTWDEMLIGWYTAAQVASIEP
jgi:peroxiredoxin